MAHIKKTVQVPKCGNTWYDQYVGCKGHEIALSYSTVTDAGTLEVDGKFAFGGGDTLFLAVADLINEKLAQPKPEYRDN